MDVLRNDNYFIQLCCIPADYYEEEFKEYEMLLKLCE